MLLLAAQQVDHTNGGTIGHLGEETYKLKRSALSKRERCGVKTIPKSQTQGAQHPDHNESESLFSPKRKNNFGVSVSHNHCLGSFYIQKTSNVSCEKTTNSEPVVQWTQFEKSLKLLCSLRQSRAWCMGEIPKLPSCAHGKQGRPHQGSYIEIPVLIRFVSSSYLIHRCKEGTDMSRPCVQWTSWWLPHVVTGLEFEICPNLSTPCAPAIFSASSTEAAWGIQVLAQLLVHIWKLHQAPPRARLTCLWYHDSMDKFAKHREFWRILWCPKRNYRSGNAQRVKNQHKPRQKKFRLSIIDLEIPGECICVFSNKSAKSSIKSCQCFRGFQSSSPNHGISTCRALVRRGCCERNSWCINCSVPANSWARISNQNLGGRHNGPKMPQITELPFNTPCACPPKLQRFHKSHKQKRFVGDKPCILEPFYLLEVLCMCLSTHQGYRNQNI